MSVVLMLRNPHLRGTNRHLTSAEGLSPSEPNAEGNQIGVTGEDPTAGTLVSVHAFSEGSRET